MRHKRLRVAVLALAVAGLMSPLPAQANGREVRILRDEYGVPHVYADDLGALYFGFGHAVAQDRLFQLEIARRTSWGTAAEVFGPDFVKLDTDQRRVGYTREQVREQMSKLGPQYRTMMKSYADGVNDVIGAIEAGKAKLPPEFNRLGIQPAPWTDEDVAQVFIACMGTRYSDGAGVIETRDAAWLKEWTEKFGPEKARIMFDDFIQATQDPQIITTIPREEDWRARAVPSRRGRGASPKASTPKPSTPAATPSGAVTGAVPPGVTQTAALFERAQAEQTSGLEKLGMPIKLGSYGWLIGKSRTLNGSAILLGGPQMGQFLPAYLTSVGLHGAGFDVVGSTPIGHLPVLFGHNANTAWSATAGYGDTVDVFVETLDPKDPTRYKYKGEWRPFEVREEVIKVKGAPDVKETFYRSVHGPIESMDVKNNVAYARSRSYAMLELESMAGWIDNSQAKDFGDFVTAARRMSISITWLYADNKGNIGMAFCGKYPIRHPQQDHRLPTPGTGERDWLGFVAPEDVPHMMNPRRGTIVNWNNMPAVGWHSPGIFTGRAHSSEEIIKFFEARPVITVEDVKESVRLGAFNDRAVPYYRTKLLNAVSFLAGGDATLKTATDAIATWDGNWLDRDRDGKWDSSGATIFDTWYRHVTNDLFAPEKVGSISSLLTYKKGSLQFGGSYGTSVVQNILEGKDSPVRLKGDYLGGRTADEVMVKALRAAIAELQAEMGADPSKWLHPVKMASFTTKNFRGIPQTYSELPEYLPMRRGSVNHIVVLSPAGVRGVDVVPPGQSGVPPAPGEPSPHFADQVKLFLDFDYKPMHFSEQDVQGNTKSTERLTYTGGAAGAASAPRR
jgi:penicillin G amidase